MSSDLTFKIPENWNVFTVDELVKSGVLEKPLDGNHGDIHPKANDYVSTGIPFIMASDLNADKVDFNSCKFITETQAKTLRKGFAKTGDVLLSHKATIGRTAIIQESKYPFFVLTPQVTYYRVKNTLKLNNVYLKSYFDSYFFQSILQQWAGAGSTRAYLGITEQLKLPIIVPDMDTQNKISKIAKDLNDKIALNTQINQTLEAMAQALFKSWFVNFDPVKAKMEARANDGDDNAVRRAAIAVISGKSADELQQFEQNNPEAFTKLAETADLFPERLVESELGEIPEGWEVKCLYDTAEYVNGGAFKAQDFTADNSGLPIIKIAELKQGISASTNYTTNKVPSKYYIKNDDVLYSWSGSPETSLEVFKWFGGDGILNQHIFKLNFQNDSQKHFTYYLLKELKPLLISTATQKQTTGLGHITVADMKRLKIACPDNSVLISFSKIIRPIYEHCSTNEKEKISLTQLRDTLLPKLLSGEIDLSSVAPELQETTK